MGLDFKNKIAYLCEVTTHIRGVLYKNNITTVSKINIKYKRQKEYANKYLSDFPKRYFMFWSPVVPKGYITEELEKIDGLEVVINKTYTQYIDELREKASVNQFLMWVRHLEVNRKQILLAGQKVSRRKGSKILF